MFADLRFGSEGDSSPEPVAFCQKLRTLDVLSDFTIPNGGLVGGLLVVTDVCSVATLSFI